MYESLKSRIDRLYKKNSQVSYGDNNEDIILCHDIDKSFIHGHITESQYKELVHLYNYS